ncbi:hypothetical protein LB467_12965, partial [Salegentibacter sp. JZCK2]|uniref:hypothetical protein n=1 Tax=Salegentibacter tibetensis TaxID=2873600 RepID=UPI001CCF637D
MKQENFTAIILFAATSAANRFNWSQKRDLNPAILLQHFSIAKKSIFSSYELSTKRLTHSQSF